MQRILQLDTAVLELSICKACHGFQYIAGSCSAYRYLESVSLGLHMPNPEQLCLVVLFVKTVFGGTLWSVAMMRPFMEK